MRAGHGAILGSESYAVLRELLSGSGCRRCTLSGARASIVVDRGSPGARLLLVGEAPGAEEDRTGLAFVGRSGKLLDSMLLEAGIDPASEALIANVVKCRPPGNRPPSPEEAAACLPYLVRQIELLHPRVIVLLGRTAARHLLPSLEKGGLTEIAGRFLEVESWPGTPVMVLFHPAYILRNPSLRGEMVDRLREVRRRLGAAASRAGAR